MRLYQTVKRNASPPPQTRWYQCVAKPHGSRLEFLENARMYARVVTVVYGVVCCKKLISQVMLWINNYNYLSGISGRWLYLDILLWSCNIFPRHILKQKDFFKSMTIPSTICKDSRGHTNPRTRARTHIRRTGMTMHTCHNYLYQILSRNH